MAFFYTYEIPKGYHWTGFEQVIAVNLDDKATSMPLQIDGDSLGQQTGAGSSGLAWSGPLLNLANLNFSNHALSANPPHDLQLGFSYAGSTLNLTLTPLLGQLHDALYVIDGTDSNGNPLYLIDYNYLRKQAYGTGVLTDSIPATATALAPMARTYGVRCSNGTLAVFTPELTTSSIAAPYIWQIGSIRWRTYEGI
jgi:hypothetical protein